MNLKTLVNPAIAIAAGGIAACGFPPNGIGILTLIGFAMIANRLPAVSARRAGLLVWLFGSIWHVIGLSWISEAFYVTMPGIGPIALLAVQGLAALLACFMAGMAYLWRRYWPDANDINPTSMIGLACALSVGEWLMGHALTGFPWTTISLAFADTMIAGTAAVTGIYGISLILLAAALAILGTVAQSWRQKSVAWRGVGMALVVCLLPVAASKISDQGVLPTNDNSPVIRMVQGNTPQREKWRPGNQAAIFAAHMKLSIAPAPKPLAAIVWPETATPFSVTEVKSTMSALGSAAPAGGYVILGAPLREKTPSGSYIYTNSLIAVDSSGSVATHYDKAHLVPGGEYIPLESYLPLGKLVPGRGSFTPGAGNATLRLPGLPPFSPLICYEVIFPGAVALDADRPAFLLNITNDAWYGASAGPYQHLAITRMRAIEEGLPLIRVANTGISAAFDGLGNELGRIGIEQTGFLDVTLPPALPPTLYARYGDWIYLILLALLLSAALAQGKIRRRRQS
jgi:apolipoprotein N-acyltransferase